MAATDPSAFSFAESLCEQKDEFTELRQLVASLDGAAVGCLEFEYTADLGELAEVVDLSVDADYRRKGVASSLWAELQRRYENAKHDEMLSPDGEQFMAAVNPDDYQRRVDRDERERPR